MATLPFPSSFSSYSFPLLEPKQLATVIHITLHSTVINLSNSYCKPNSAVAQTHAALFTEHVSYNPETQWCSFPTYTCQDCRSPGHKDNPKLSSKDCLDQSRHSASVEG